MLFKEVIGVYCEYHIQDGDIFWQSATFCMLERVVHIVAVYVFRGSNNT
jgi:hypothetical protein